MKRTAGPIAVSGSLARIFGMCRSLRAQALAEGQKDLAANAALSIQPGVDVADVVLIESQLGVALPDEILGVIASQTPVLDAVTGLEFTIMADVAERAAEVLPPEWVAIGEASHRPLDPTDDGMPTLYLCIPRVPSSGELHVLVWDIDAEAADPPQPIPFADFVRDQFTRSFPQWTAWAGVLSRSKPDGSLQPALTGLRVSQVPQIRRVRHKVYGEGTVLGDAGDGKLRVEFEGVGTKVLLASFVTDL